MTRLAEPIIIAQWWKNRGGESVRVTLSTYADRNLIDLRTRQRQSERPARCRARPVLC